MRLAATGLAMALALGLGASPALGTHEVPAHGRHPLFHLSDVVPPPQPLATWLDQWLEQPNMLGDWGGLRSTLARLGIVPTISFVTDIQGNPIGGKQQALREFDNLAVEVDIDLATLLGAPGTKFHLGMSQRSGTDLSTIDVGNVFQVAEVCCGATFRLADVFLEQPFWGDRVNVRAGRIAAGDEFMTSPLYWFFLNGFVNGNPGGIFLNAPGMTVYPVATWGVRVRASPFESLYVMAGAFNGDPTLGANSKHGVDWTARGPLFTMAEIGYLLNQKPGDIGLPGNFKVGAYYNGGPFSQFLGGSADGGPGPTVQGNAGWYLLADQMVYRPGGPSSPVGLTAFFSFLMSPATSISTMPLFIDGGLVYRGLWPGRPNDVAGFAVIYGSFSSDLRQSQRSQRQAGVAATIQDYELVFEWNYSIQVARWLAVQPDVQYVVKPGGSGAIPNALVVGVQIAVNF